MCLFGSDPISPFLSYLCMRRFVPLVEEAWIRGMWDAYIVNGADEQAF